MKIKIKTKKGFTLLEVMAVMGIVAVMTAVALSAIVNSRNQTELESAANEVMAAIRETQNYALTGKKDESDNVCTQYTFSPGTPTNNSYTILGGPIQTCSNFSVTQKLSGGVTFNGSSSISFSTPHADVTPIGGATIVLIKGSNDYCVFVNNAGLITKGQCP
ncbi:MAG: type II secretion system protein [Parcubacteria group bacterium]|jgi:prepilin-type N-terminal cleavage/methylation domain-containing protein|nr:type II secretion system protein [Candidatus Moranbacteria bacterium]